MGYIDTARDARPSLREFLDARGVRYIWVAEQLGISPAHMSRLMSGERPVTPENATKLADLFSVDPSTFLPENTR